MDTEILANSLANSISHLLAPNFNCRPRQAAAAIIERVLIDQGIAELTAENEQLREVVDALMEGVIAADQQPERMESPDMLATLRKLAED